MSHSIIVLDFLKPLGCGTPVFDDTMCRVVSSLWDFSDRRGVESPIFDDTMSRIVSSLRMLFGSPRRGITVFDDTMCRVVSSLLVGSRSPRSRPRFLMILHVAGYHHFWLFEGAEAQIPGF